MRHLIQYMPETAKLVLDRCINPTKRKKGKNKGEEETEKDKAETAETGTSEENSNEEVTNGVTFFFEYLDDYFSSWARNFKDTSKHPARNYTFNDTTGSLEHDDLKAHKKNILVDHPLIYMVKANRMELVTHPVTIALIESKRKVGYLYYAATLTLYLLYLTLLTGYVMVNPPSFYVKFYNETEGVIWYRGTEEDIVDKFSSSTRIFYGNVAGWFILVLVILLIGIEMFTLKMMKWDYFTWEKLLIWPMYILSVLQVIPVGNIVFMDGVTLREEWQWECGAVAILFAWFNLVLFLRYIATIGLYVFMFQVILWSTLKFLIVFLLFLMAFTFAFYNLLLNQEPFHTFFSALQKTFVMTIGEMDYTTIFHSQNYLGTENTQETDGEDAYILTAVFSNNVTNVIFSVFIFLMPIIAINMLIGIAVEDIHQIRQEANYYYLAMQIKLHITAQNIVEGIFLHYMKFLAVTRQFRYQSMKGNKKHLSDSFSRGNTSEFQDNVRKIVKRNRERGMTTESGSEKKRSYKMKHQPSTSSVGDTSHSDTAQKATSSYDGDKRNTRIELVEKEVTALKERMDQLEVYVNEKWKESTG